MGNGSSFGRGSSTSGSDDAGYQQLLQHLKANPDIALENMDSLMDCMDFIFSKLKQPNQEKEASSSSSSSSEWVTQSGRVGRRIVHTLSTQIESQVTCTPTNKRTCTIGRMSTSKMKQRVLKALESETTKLVAGVLDKAQQIPYIGVATSIVVYLLDQYEKSSSNVDESMKLLEHLYHLAKCLKDVGSDENTDQMLSDMLGFIFKSTVSLAQHINQSSFERFASACPDSSELQSMRNDLMLEYQQTQLRTLLDIYKNVPRLPQAPSKVYCASNAVGIEGAMEKVKKKLNMGVPSRKVVIIWGLGGMGKTTLGDHVYNCVVDKSRYSHCKLEMDIKTTDIPKLQFQLLNQAFQETEDVLNARQGQARISKAIEKSSFHSKPLFLYIDNASIKVEVESLFPTKSLSSLPKGSKIMVTTRNLKEVVTWTDIPGFEFEEFRMEETAEAKKMLSYYALGDENGSFEEDVDVDKLLELCMGIPLIIQMAAKKLRDLNIRRLMVMSEACRNVIEHMQSLKNGGGWEKEDMHRMVDFVYEQLPQSFQRIFLDIVFFFINWRRYKVVCIFGEIVIGELEDAALLSTNEEGRLKVHDIIKMRAHAFSKGSRICDRDSWERLKKHPEEFNAIEGLHINIEEDDMEYVNRCHKIKILILEREERQRPVKVHLASSVEILCLKGHFIHNENLLNIFKVLKMKMNEFEKGFTNYQSFREVKYLDLVKCKGIDISACISHALSSCRRLRLSDAKLEMLPHGHNKVHCQLRSLKLDKCYNVRILPDILIRTCSSINISSMTGCESFKTLPPSFGLLKNLEKLNLRECENMEALCEIFGSLSKLKVLTISYCKSLKTLPPSFGQLENLEKLYLSDCKSLESLCENFGSLSKLKELTISCCGSLQALPPSFGLLKNLEKLDMSHCESLVTLCENFGNLSKLRELDIRFCRRLQALPPSFGQLENLEKLYFSDCRSLETLSENFGSLSKLKELTISYCISLQALPPSFGLLKNLDTLFMDCCPSLVSLGENFGSLSNLIKLNIGSCESLQVLPPSFGLLKNLEKLGISYCRSLESLGENFGSLSKLIELNIGSCESLQILPPSFGLLKNLEKLNMWSCRSLERLSENFGSLSKLEVVNIRNCEKLTTLPITFGGLKCLKKLEISDCQSLKSFCENFGSLSKLEVLKIWDCKSLETLPPSFGLLKNLQKLIICGCTGLEDLPEGLKDMHALRRLGKSHFVRISRFLWITCLHCTPSLLLGLMVWMKGRWLIC